MKIEMIHTLLFTFSRIIIIIILIIIIIIIIMIIITIIIIMIIIIMTLIKYINWVALHLDYATIYNVD